MKRLVPFAALAGLLLGVAIAAAAAHDTAAEAAELAPAIEPACAEAAPPAPTLEDLLTPPAQPVCSCRNRCFSDAQCELIYGPGSQCVPVGSCQCRECLATS